MDGARRAKATRLHHGHLGRSAEENPGRPAIRGKNPPDRRGDQLPGPSVHRRIRQPRNRALGRQSVGRHHGQLSARTHRPQAGAQGAPHSGRSWPPKDPASGPADATDLRPCLPSHSNISYRMIWKTPGEI